MSNRLLSEGRSGANSYAQTFAYDSAGNRTLKNVDSARTTYVYDTANQLDYSNAAGGRTTYVYDQNGNQRVEQTPAGARTTVTWDYENQPTEYQLPSGSRMTLVYNADNRRVQKETSSGLTQFIWDAALDAYHAELDGSDSLQAVYTNPPVPFGNLISQRRGTTSHWHHPDSLGSTWALTDASESITDTYLVDAWGNPLSSTGTTINPFRWVGNVGYYFDPESGLYYIRARVYQPTIARWTSVDPLFYFMAKSGSLGLQANLVIASSPDWNCFRYAVNAPARSADASGLEVPPYEDSMVNTCIQYLRSIVAGAGAFAQYPCTRSLLSRFLAGNQRGGTCTDECKDKLARFDWSRHFAFMVATSHAYQCGFTGRVDLSNRVFPFRGIVPAWPGGPRDFVLAFNEFDLKTFNAACDINCGLGRVCDCCVCNATCGGELVIQDDYDFCSSYQEGNYPISPVEQAFRCACILEDFRERQGAHPGTFKVHCPTGHRTMIKFRKRVCNFVGDVPLDPEDPFV